MTDNMYKVFDSLGNLMRKFSTYQAAATYKMAYGNNGWTIRPAESDWQEYKHWLQGRKSYVPLRKR